MPLFHALSSASAGPGVGRRSHDGEPFGVDEVEVARAAALESERLGRALAGDGRAFCELVEPHLAVMFRVASRVSGSRAAAEDAVQEALTIVYQRLGSYRAGTSLRAFLAAIAARQAETLLRSERRRKRREGAIEHAAAAPSPAESFEANATAQALRSALLALPEKRRAVALLRFDAGLSYAEIAQALGTSEASAKSLAHLATVALRAALAQLDPNVSATGQQP